MRAETMTKNLAIRVLLIMPLLLTGWGFRQEQPSQAKEFVVEGSIVAIQKRTRHPVKPEPGGIGTFVELWIVRIDQWPSGMNRNEKYILVQYDLYERGLSDAEVNSKKLRFTLRERREDEHTDCLGTITEGNKSPYKRRPIGLSDYERMEPGKLDEIPPLESLPCLIADRPPVVAQ